MLDAQERRVLALIALLFSLSPQQVLELSLCETPAQIGALRPLDAIQKNLIELSCLSETRIKKTASKVFNDSFPADLWTLVRELNPEIVSRSLDEQNMESDIMMPLIERSMAKKAVAYSPAQLNLIERNREK